MMKSEADRAKCDGLGMCEAMAPDFFEVGDDGTVVTLDEEYRQDLSAAVDVCPVLALKSRGWSSSERRWPGCVRCRHPLLKTAVNREPVLTPRSCHANTAEACALALVLVS
jgi:ferredoxin